MSAEKLPAILSKELSPNFSWEEAQITQQRDLDNTIPAELRPAIRFVASKMEAVRSLLGSSPLIINSWYRSPEVNAAVGGSTRSDHMKGLAVDFICPRAGSPLDIVRKISKFAQLIGFDQLILEHTWVHISFSIIPGMKPKLEVLTLLKDKKYAQGITDVNGNPIV